MSPALEGGYLTTESPRKSPLVYFFALVSKFLTIINQCGFKSLVLWQSNSSHLILFPTIALIFPVSYIKSSCQDTHTQAVILIGVLLILHINLERTGIFIMWKLLFMTFPFTYLFKSLLLFHPLQDGEDKEAWHATVHRVIESRT